MTGTSRTALVSFVMPTFRPRPDWLRAAVESVLREPGCELELVVVDDGSPEPVSPLLEAVADDRLRVVRCEHGGTSRARNAGVARAQGDFVRFVDSDDVLAHGSTAHLVELSGGTHVAYGATRFCDEELRPGSVLVCRISGPAGPDLLVDRFDVTLPALVFPRWVVDRVGEWDPAIAVCQDWDYILRARELAPVRGDDRLALDYRRHRDGASAGLLASPEALRRSEEGMRLVVQRYFERHPDERGGDLERLAAARIELVMAQTYRTAYLRSLGRAWPGDATGVARELGALLRVLARLLARKAVPAPLRRVRRPGAAPRAGGSSAAPRFRGRSASPPGRARSRAR